MVIDSQSRTYGNMGYTDNMYSSHLHSAPHFTDPWGSQSTAQSHAPAFATSMPKQEIPRPITMSYPQISVSAPALASGSSYSSVGFAGSDLLSLPQDIPRSNYPSDQTYHTSGQTNTTFNPSPYSSLNYTHSLHQQQQQQQDVRRMSDPYVHHISLREASH